MFFQQLEPPSLYIYMQIVAICHVTYYVAFSLLTLSDTYYLIPWDLRQIAPFISPSWSPESRKSGESSKGFR